ncbi:MAG: 2-hydroxyglutaryl-CoA dehydratase [Bradymonadales bacterium]|nr:2-hydroxyglutaryl-CoA dehydratase [Bradymonadales bacterium]
MTRLYAGCDVGSTTGKVVILDDHQVVATALIPSEVDPADTARLALDLAASYLPDPSAARSLARLVGTGYGRNEVPFADENISEITCHAVGAQACNPSVRTVIDVGGQDVKAIALNPDGTVLDFAMNDKCAAGTGRFFEAMARILRIDLDRLSELSAAAASVAPITSQCSVFAETEVVSLIARRTPPPDIAAGIQLAVARRVYALARRVGVQPAVAMTGGCAKNHGLVLALQPLLRQELVPLDMDPQLIGALGAAVLARRKGMGR